MNTVKIYILFIFICISSFTVSAQRCTYTDLSEEFEFSINVRRYKPASGGDSVFVRLFVADLKTNKPLQQISYSSLDFFNDVFMNCENVRSYSTGKNKKIEVENGNYGDLVVADLNFDNREDIAIINHSGGNSGPSYSFYMQTKDNQFELDSNLTSMMNFFPSEIHTFSRTLTTIVPTSASEKTRTVYHYHRKSKTWTKAHQEFITEK